AHAADASPRHEDHRYPGGREPLRDHRSLRSAGRCNGTERVSARALSRQGDVRAVNHAERKIGDLAPHPELELQLAGRISVCAADRVAARLQALDALTIATLLWSYT